MRLTAHFLQSEFDVHEPIPDRWRYKAALHAQQAEAWRAASGARYMQVTSCYRSPERNDAVNGADNSEHLTADAADYVFAGVSDRAIGELALLALERRVSLPAWGQLIVYKDTAHNHLSLPRTDGRPNNQALIAWRDSSGVRRYKPLTRANVGELSGFPALPNVTPMVRVLAVVVGAVIAWRAFSA